jgi:hypothetical protein
LVINIWVVTLNRKAWSFILLKGQRAGHWLILPQIYQHRLTGAPSPERAAISSNPFFAFRTPTEVAAEINMLGNQYLGGNFEPQGLEFYSNQRSTGRSLADIAADLSASPEGQAFAQTGAPSPERAAISSNPFNQGIVAALPGSTASTT